MTEENARICVKCEQSKHQNSFYTTRRGNNSWYRRVCKSCDNARRNRSHQAHTVPKVCLVEQKLGTNLEEVKQKLISRENSLAFISNKYNIPYSTLSLYWNKKIVPTIRREVVQEVPAVPDVPVV
jgi:hypothetical protein